MEKLDLKILKHPEWTHLDDSYHLALNQDAPTEAQTMWQAYLQYLEEAQQSKYDY